MSDREAAEARYERACVECERARQAFLIAAAEADEAYLALTMATIG